MVHKPSNTILKRYIQAKDQNDYFKWLSKTSLYKCSHTFNGSGHKVWWGLGLLDPVALHDLSLLGEPEEPGSARLLLPIHSGRVDDVVVLKNGLFELAFWCEHLLQKDRVKDIGRDEEMHTEIKRVLQVTPEKRKGVSVSLCLYLLTSPACGRCQGQTTYYINVHRFHHTRKIEVMRTKLVLQ